MARKPRSPHTENRTNRLKLEPRRKPYFTAIAPGIRLGYRRNQGAGSWSVKVADGRGGHWIKVFAVADDHQDADGSTVLTYWQAIDKARAVAGSELSGSSITVGDRPITVAEALADYGSALQTRNGDKLNVTRVLHHLPKALADKTVALLTARELRQWREAMLKSGLAPASADRTARALKAALSMSAREDSRITNEKAWRDGLARLPDAEVARNEILTDEQVRALIAAAYALSPAYGLWIEVHAVTGARTSQIERLEVRDLQDGAQPRLMMPSSKKGRRRRIERKPVPISPALAKALRLAVKGKSPHEPLVRPPGGETLLRNWLKRAVATAGLPRKTVMYSLRHSSVVRAIKSGIPLRIIAVVHDSSTAMLEKHYSAYIGDHSDTLVRRAMLDTGAVADSKVVPLGRK